MANCYRCGATNAAYRRTTYTGHTSGSWWSNRSSGSSSQTHYGVRSVCIDCAKSIDTWNRVKFFLGLAIVLIIALSYLARQNAKSGVDNSPKQETEFHYTEPTASVTSTTGLNLRSEPTSSSTVITTIPFNETVGIVDSNGISETLSGRTANWFKVNYKGSTGWLWSGYLKMQDGR